MLLRRATIADVEFIARGFHMAMLYENTPDEQIRQMAEVICRREDVLYSWRNTLIAEVDGQPAGMITAYDGQYYRDWRRKTFELAAQVWSNTFPDMEDEAVEGEYYLDSLAVWPAFRGRGIGRELLKAAIAEGKRLGLKVTLAVDPVNERAERLYRSLGFSPAGSLFIFGHTYYKMEQ